MKTLTDRDVENLVEKAVNSKIGPWKHAAAGIGVFTAIFAVLGVTWAEFRHFLFEKMYPPEVVYEKLKKSLHDDKELRDIVAADIVRLIGERVDSGYSKTLYFGPDEIPRNGQDLLQFHARPTQKVELSLKAWSSKKNVEFIVTVNNKNLFYSDTGSNPKFDLDIPARDITSFIEYKRPSALDSEAEKKLKSMFIHTIRVLPVGLPRNAEATFEILVLVRNEET